MGCGMSTEEREGKARNEEIENQLKKDRMMQRNEIKMLLLGRSPQTPFHRNGATRQPSANTTTATTTPCMYSIRAPNF